MMQLKEDPTLNQASITSTDMMTLPNGNILLGSDTMPLSKGKFSSLVVGWRRADGLKRRTPFLRWHDACKMLALD